MRLIAALLTGCLYGTALADPPAPPSGLQPLPPPPRTGAGSDDADLEPPVTIIKRTEQTIEEFRANGKLYMIKITPKVGPPYYLIDDRGDGKFSRMESLDSGIRPPRWTLLNF